MRYFTFFHAKSLRSGVYFILTAPLNLDLLHFKRSVDRMSNSVFHIRQSRTGGMIALNPLTSHWQSSSRENNSE